MAAGGPTCDVLISLFGEKVHKLKSCHLFCFVFFEGFLVQIPKMISESFFSTWILRCIRWPTRLGAKGMWFGQASFHHFAGKQSTALRMSTMTGWRWVTP